MKIKQLTILLLLTSILYSCSSTESNNNESFTDKKLDSLDTIIVRNEKILAKQDSISNITTPIYKQRDSLFYILIDINTQYLSSRNKEKDLAILYYQTNNNDYRIKANKQTKIGNNIAREYFKVKNIYDSLGLVLNKYK